MGVTAKTFVESNTMSGLAVDIAAAIAAGKQPSGDVIYDPNTGLYYQAMVTGDGSSSNANYAVNGALNPAGGLAVLTKASAGAYTLAAPAYEGAELDISAGTDFAHVVTATGLIKNGVTGGAKNTMTTAAFAGAGIRLRGIGGFWHVMSANLVTVA